MSARPIFPAPMMATVCLLSMPISEGAFGRGHALVRAVAGDGGAQGPRHGLEEGLDLVVRVVAVKHADMEGAAQVFREGEPEMPDHLGR